MTVYCVPYSTENCVADVTFYDVDEYEELFPLLIEDFFSYDTVNEGVTVPMSVAVLKEYKETDNFYDICASFGFYFGIPIELNEALQYVHKKAED